MDSYIKLVDLRSREFDPATDPFLTKDSWQGDDTYTPTYTPMPSGPVAINYTYDAFNRITGADYSNGLSFAYACRSNGEKMNVVYAIRRRY